MLFQASVVELVSITGVCEATAARIKSALALLRYFQDTEESLLSPYARLNLRTCAGQQV